MENLTSIRARYRPERTLARGLRRMPEQTKEDFHNNVHRLREHFEQFNRDVSEVCQWLMGIRPGRSMNEESDSVFGDEIKPFWDFFLTPETTLPNLDETNFDYIRLEVFSVAAGWKKPNHIAEYNLTDNLLKALYLLSVRPYKDGNKSAVRLFRRLEEMSPTQRMIVLKSAADWVFARYQRLLDNWNINRPIWETEKSEWEARHPNLTPEIRRLFTDIFQNMGIKNKSPRICLAERLIDIKNNCEFNGQKIPQGNPEDKSKSEPQFVAHSQNCFRYWNFCRQRGKGEKKFNKKVFAKNAKRYLEIYARSQGRKTTDHERMQTLYRELEKDKKIKVPFDRWEFPTHWKEYLKEMNLNVGKLLESGGIENLHCISFKGDCQFNRHTDLCLEYAERIKTLPIDCVQLDRVYREWRRKFLAGPKRPTFTYPSAASPTPKIFGRNYYRIDWERSVVGIRLDDMPPGKFLEFSFQEWPDAYDIQDVRDRVSSVHLNFVGTRARIAFRFDVTSKKSRIGLTQEKMEQLRSGEFRPREDEREFPAEVRNAILKSFTGDGDPEQELRILTVDTGTDSGGAVGLFVGRKFEKCEPLKIVKSKKLYLSAKEIEFEREFELSNGTIDKRRYVPGVSREHHQLHLEKYDYKVSDLVLERPVSKKKGARVSSRSDLRRLKLHSSWMIRDWARLNASQIMKAAVRHKVDLILLESQRGFLAPGYNRVSEAIKKHRMAFWPYGQVRRKVTEKAVERGMRVALLPYKGSSKICPECGGRQSKPHFCKCLCGYKPDSRDESAVRVLGLVFWGELTLPGEKSLDKIE